MCVATFFIGSQKQENHCSSHPAAVTASISSVVISILKTISSR
jgi:hypothetical protein